MKSHGKSLATLCINWIGGTVADWVGFDDGGFSNCH